MSMKRKRLIWRLALGAAALCLVLALAAFGLSGLVRLRVRDRIVTAEEAAAWGADCVLVLGAGVRPDGSPSLMLAERVDAGLSLWRAGAADKLLMSGDHGRADYDEVNVMKDRATAAGVPSSAVFMDHAGFSTYDSLYRAKAVFAASKVVIVTQRYHLYRALYIADRLGLEAVGVPCDTRTYAGQTYRDLREVLARDKDALKCLFRPKPTYLGEVIPVSGSGDATNDRA